MRILPTYLADRKDSYPRIGSSRFDKSRALAIANLLDDREYTAYEVTKIITSDVYSNEFKLHRRALQSYAKRHLREPDRSTERKGHQRQSWPGLGWKSTLSAHIYDWVQHLFDRLLKLSAANKTLNLETHFFWKNNELECRVLPILRRPTVAALTDNRNRAGVAVLRTGLVKVAAVTSTKWSEHWTFVVRRWFRPLCLAIVTTIFVTVSVGFSDQTIPKQLSAQNFQDEEERSALREEFQIPVKQHFPDFIYQNESGPKQDLPTPKGNSFGHSTRSSQSPI